MNLKGLEKFQGKTQFKVQINSHFLNNLLIQQYAFNTKPVEYNFVNQYRTVL